MTEEQEKKLDRIIKTQLERQKSIGIKIGAIAVSRRVLEILDDSSRPLTKRIADIRRLCSISNSFSKDIGATEDNSEKVADESEGQA